MAKQHHGHDHDMGAEPHVHLISVGIDIGSSTSHLMFSQLQVGIPTPQRRRPEVLERKVVHRSKVLLTPFSGNWNIEPGPLKELIDQTFKEASLTPEAVDTGAVIVTGEAARRDNAQKIAELFSDQTGRFVCATAGPKLEAVMAAHGSGTVGRSREESLTLLNIDVGGGTTKLSLVRNGIVHGSSALNIGARLVAFDGEGRICRLEKSGARFLRDLGQAAKIGDAIGEEACEQLALRMAQVLFDVLEGKAVPWEELLIIPRLPRLPALDGILFSGGVSEYIYGREATAFGDLGPLLGNFLKEAARSRGYQILDNSEGIRATVIGASQYSMQLSGETIYIPEPEKLPLHNLRVFIVRVTWDPPVAERAEKAVWETWTGLDPEVKGGPYALVFSSPPFLGYGSAQELGKGIRAALERLEARDRPRMLVFEQNVGRVVGEMLPPQMRMPCVDEISLSELDFIDIGEIVRGESYVPVIVKSLAFGV